MKQIFIFLMSCCVAIHCAFADTTQKAPVTDATSNQVESDYISDQFKLTPKSYHEENKLLPYTIDATYPQIVGDNLTPAALQFNALVIGMVKKEIDRFKRYVTADMPHMQNLPADVKQNSLNIDYDNNIIRPNGNTIISIRLAIQGMQAGRAHPYHSHTVLNFDLANSKTLMFNDLFKQKANFLKIIAAYSKQELNKKLTDKWMIADGTKPLAKNFKNWNLEADGILFTLDEYQVASYVDGAQEITIPYAQLQAVLADTAPIRVCIGDSKACLVQMVIPESEDKIEQSRVAI